MARSGKAWRSGGKIVLLSFISSGDCSEGCELFTLFKKVKPVSPNVFSVPVLGEVNSMRWEEMIHPFWLRPAAPTLHRLASDPIFPELLTGCPPDRDACVSRITEFIGQERKAWLQRSLSEHKSHRGDETWSRLITGFMCTPKYREHQHLVGIKDSFG